MLDSAPPRPRIVVMSSPVEDGWRWFEGEFPELDWRFFDDRRNSLEEATGLAALAKPRACLQAVLEARRVGAALLICHLPAYAGWCATFARVLGVNIPVLGFSFNFTELPKGVKRALAARMLSGVQHFVVFSQMERTLYANALALPVERFEMVHWAVRPPEYSEGRLEEGDYLCAIGGNARDYASLLHAAAALPDIPFVLVVRPESLDGLRVPPNVRVRINLPFHDTMNVLKHSRFMVLPLLGSEVPCGHVTLVMAMHLGKTFVITNSSGVADYAIDGVNCVTIPPNDPGALADKIRELWQDPARVERLESGALPFAREHCAESVAIEYLRKVLAKHGLTTARPGAPTLEPRLQA